MHSFIADFTLKGADKHSFIKDINFDRQSLNLFLRLLSKYYHYTNAEAAKTLGHYAFHLLSLFLHPLVQSAVYVVLLIVVVCHCQISMTFVLI